MADPFGLGGTGSRVAAILCCFCPAVDAEPSFSYEKDYSSPVTALFIDPLLINHSLLNRGVLGVWGFGVMG